MSSSLTIFLAEDSAADAFLVREALRSANLDFELLRANDGESAKRALQKAEREHEHIDLILLDLNLPRVSGHELLAYIRQSTEFRDLPVIVLTSSDSPDDRARASAQGIDYYFRKPSEFSEFLRLGEIIQRVCSKASAN